MKPGNSFPLPAILNCVVSPAEYNNWVRVKAWALYKRDKRRKLALALNGSVSLYKQAVHGAVEASGLLDPYTGETLDWKLIGTWDPQQGKTNDDYVKQFYRMPTVDHSDPYGQTLAFEMCAWEVNCCKSFLNPQEFIDQCKRIAVFRAGWEEGHRFISKDAHPGRRLSADIPNSPRSTGLRQGTLSSESRLPGLVVGEHTYELPCQMPVVYPLPLFLQGVCTLPQYSKWLLERAKELYKRDKRMQRTCARDSSRSLYRKAIHASACASGLCDPYTGDRLAWERIGTWDTGKGVDDHEIFRKEFALLPTVDHTNPEMIDLDFEICSWQINCCKSGRTPDEFVGLCREVARYRAQG